ncbi:MAG: patatin-like phospholipase family protein [Salinivenus sp.]
MFRDALQTLGLEAVLPGGSSDEPTYALVLNGGGARSAYQAGVLRYVAETFPGTYFPVLSGVSAGAINTAQLGNHTGTLKQATEHLVESWEGLELDQIVTVESGFGMLWGLMAWQWPPPPDDGLDTETIRRTHGLLDTTPLAKYLRRRFDVPSGDLTGVEANLDDGRLQALAVIATRYATGQTVTWVEGDDVDAWERHDRVGVQTQLTIDHVMASTAIPLVFPAVQIGDYWYGDGGIRLSAPLAPAVNLGADHILAISTRYRHTKAEAERVAGAGYPPTAQIFGVLMNSIFVDAMDQDAEALKRMNALLRELPPRKRHGMHPVDILQLRPSVDLARLARDYQDRIPSAFQFLTTGLGVDETQSPDWLSVLLFAPSYIDRLLDIGYHDARHAHDRIEAFLADQVTGDGAQSVQARAEERPA